MADEEKQGMEVQEYREPKGILNLEIPDAEKVIKNQKELMGLAEKICDERDFMWAVFTIGSEAKPDMYTTEQEAKKRKEQIEKTLKDKKAEIVKMKRKSAWNKLALSLGVTAPLSQRNVSIKKEAIVLEGGTIAIKTTGPGYESMTFLGQSKRPDGSVTLKVLHSECTMAMEWDRAGRLSVRSGACSASERKFTHGTHDVIAMAETRASSRSIATCLGFGDTTAEELDGNEDTPISEPIPDNPKNTAPKDKKKESKTKEKTAKPAESKKDDKKDDKPAAKPDEEKSAESVKEETKPEEKAVDKEDTMEKRKEAVAAAGKELGDPKAVITIFESWKTEKGIDQKARLSDINTEQWQDFIAQVEKEIEGKSEG